MRSQIWKSLDSHLWASLPCAWPWSTHRLVLVMWLAHKQDVSNDLKGHTFQHIQIYSCVLHEGFSLWTTPLGFLIIVSFPAPCLDLVSTQTGDVIWWCLPRQEAGENLYIFTPVFVLSMTCTRAQTINTHALPLGYTHTYISTCTIYVISILFNNTLMQAALYNRSRLASKHRTVPLVRLSLCHSLLGGYMVEYIA